jgi:hypothetical protein
MKITNHTLIVSTLALAASFQAFAASPAVSTANEPAYNLATTTQVAGIVTSVRQVPSGSPLAGTHLTLKSKNAVVDVYLGPSDFLRFLKVSFPVGDEISVTGSKVKLDNADVILSQRVDDGSELITLRDSTGNGDWQHWGQEIDPSLVK